MNTLLDDKVDSVVFEEKMVRPAKQWRNRYWSREKVWCPKSRRYVGPGQYWGLTIWPSKDAAETHAQSEMSRVSGCDYYGYIGAFPLPVTP